ncbi:MAG: hypothetical protein ACKOHH_01365, partial [Bacteroidota bacterium]
SLSSDGDAGSLCDPMARPAVAGSIGLGGLLVCSLAGRTYNLLSVMDDPQKCTMLDIGPNYRPGLEGAFRVVAITMAF